MTDEGTAGQRWVVYSEYGSDDGPGLPIAAGQTVSLDEEGMHIDDGPAIPPTSYMVGNCMSGEERGRYKTEAGAERKAAELNRLDVQGPLDPEFAERRKRLKRLAPRFGYLHSGPEEARWPVRPARYLIEGYDRGYHGEEWHELVDTKAEVKTMLAGWQGNEAMRVIDLDTGDEVDFQITVSVEMDDV